MLLLILLPSYQSFHGDYDATFLIFPNPNDSIHERFSCIIWWHCTVAHIRGVYVGPFKFVTHRFWNDTQFLAITEMVRRKVQQSFISIMTPNPKKKFHQWPQFYHSFLTISMLSEVFYLDKQRIDQKHCLVYICLGRVMNYTLHNLCYAPLKGQR